MKKINKNIVSTFLLFSLLFGITAPNALHSLPDVCENFTADTGSTHECKMHNSTKENVQSSCCESKSQEEKIADMDSISFCNCLHIPNIDLVTINTSKIETKQIFVENEICGDQIVNLTNSHKDYYFQPNPINTPDIQVNNCVFLI
ncbi:MAG: hypothetical protein K9G44_12555 [Melioribacteraceae bacterium]|nr:hypothetical protein [Melioribacteraceae bacterium]